MKYSTGAIIVFLFAIPFFTGCKKEIVDDTGINYFMIYLTNSSVGPVKITSTRYNANPQNIVVNEDSIVFKQAGLYHFEGYISVSGAIRISAASPVTYELTMFLKGRAYGMVLSPTTTVGGADHGASNFSIDIPVQANDGIRFMRGLYNTAGGNFITRFSGYMIRKL
jgi:hypothetical protein